MGPQFETRLFLLCTALVLTFSGLFYAFAADDTTTDYTIVDGVDYACGQAVMEQASVVVDSYQTFLNEYFQVDRPSSDQVEDAMSYYRYMRDSINQIYEDSSNVKTNNTLENATIANNYCSYVRDQYLSFAQVLLQKQVILSSNSKRTFKIIDGLNSINKNLDDLSENFEGIFPGLFSQLNNDLPCYARQCITK